MLDNEKLIVIVFGIICIMLFGNTKVRVLPILIKQIDVFKNARNDKISIWDIICFFAMPIMLSLIITIGLEYVVDDKLASVLTTVFSLIFTVLFGFAAILVGKIDSKNVIEKKVIGETFVSIVSSTILSLIVSVLSIVIIKINNSTIITILTILIYSTSFIILMLILMITKRTFIIYSNFTDEEEK